MDKSTEAIFWLKEFSKSWVYIISDEVVYYEQVWDSDSWRVTGVSGTYIEAYLSRNLWLEILFEVTGWGELEFYVALVESFESVNIEIFPRAGQAGIAPDAVGRGRRGEEVASPV